MPVDLSETAPKTMTAEALVTGERETRQDQLRTMIRAARAGDSAAFEEIMILTERYVARISWRILGDAEEVKDAMQETFLRVFRHLGRYDDQHDFFAWLTRITVNVCRDALRGRRKRSVLDPLDHDLQVANGERRADEELVRGDDLALLRCAIDRLPPKERLAILLRDVEGLPIAEVAAALGNTAATVRVQLSRARVKLRHFVRRTP